VFGRYHLFDRIGAGGMAEIFLARATTELGGVRLCVVKLILSELSGNDKFAEMLTTEAKLAARLNHANVVQVFDLGRHESVLYIAMEYVEGFDLNALLRRCAQSGIPLPVDFALFVVMEALRGLGYAHRLTDDNNAPLGIVHRDVSPSNLLISFEGEVKLCDFGIARANDTTDLLSEEGIQGKAGYMSPEHASGGPLDARSDLFAAGIVLWELLAGRKLYRARKDGGQPTLLEQARAAAIPDLPSRGLPSEDFLYDIVKRALQPNPEDRYPSAQAMLRDLEEYVGRSRLVASPIRFGEWLRDHFEESVVLLRRSRERVAKAMQHGPLAVIKPLEDPTAADDLPRPKTLSSISTIDASSGTSPDRTAEAGDDTARVQGCDEGNADHRETSLVVYWAVGILIGLVMVGLVWAFR